MNTQVGLVCGASTGTVYAVINPDDDSELDNPRWLLIKVALALREPLAFVKVGLDEYMACTDPVQVQALANRSFNL